MTNVSGANFNPISNMDLQGMDLETAMMAVQANRAKNLEDQMNSQLETVKNQNAKMANLNELMSAINTAISKFDPKKPEDKLGQTKGWGANGNHDVASGMSKAAEKAGYSFDHNNGNIKKSELEVAVQDIKTKIDSASNNQQMDMIRLQGLSNKRNEAFETMTNFIKKMQDSRNSIVSNMR